MSIKYSILGFLSWKSMTGYDLKKLFQDSLFLPWSGNNNQIYKALVELHKEELAEQTIEHNDDSPSRKIYTITEKGEKALKLWVQSESELPVLKNMILGKLAWADCLSKDEINTILQRYEEMVHNQFLLHQEKRKREEVFLKRTKREEFIWEMIWDNGSSYYKNELKWVTKLRNGLMKM
jgi:PadR family transcriptional regulator AphA